MEKPRLAVSLGLWQDRPAGEVLRTAQVADELGYGEIGIATFKLPERLELRDELPRNPLGKVLKRELRSELHGA